MLLLCHGLLPYYALTGYNFYSVHVNKVKIFILLYMRGPIAAMYIYNLVPFVLSPLFCIYYSLFFFCIDCEPGTVYILPRLLLLLWGCSIAWSRFVLTGWHCEKFSGFLGSLDGHFIFFVAAELVFYKLLSTCKSNLAQIT